MAEILGQQVEPFNNQQWAVLLAPLAALSKNEGAFRRVVDMMQIFKEDATRFEESSKYLKLDVARTDAYLARTKKQLAEEQKKNVELTTELEQSRQLPVKKLCHVCSETVENEEKSEEGESSKSETKTKAVAFRPESSGIPYEQHEVLIQQLMNLKQELRNLAKKNGQDGQKIMDAIEYKQIITGLQQDIQDQADENERLLERIQKLCSQENVPASKLVEMEFKNDKLQQRLDLGQFMIETLSKRYEELKDKAEMSRLPKREEKAKNEENSKITKEKEGHDPVFMTLVKKAEPLASGNDEVDGSLTFETLKNQTKRYETEIKLLGDQVKQVLANNKQLVTESYEAERQRGIFEERYNKLMETLRNDQEKKRQCSNCRTQEQELAKLKCEVVDLKDINELIQAQMKSYEEDLRQEQMDTANLKLRHSFQIEQWKKNCQRMGQQVDLLMDDLRKERDVTKKLKQHVKQEKPLRAMSMAPTFSNQRCAPPKSSPWQAGYRDEVEADGPGHDEPDGRDFADSLPAANAASVGSMGLSGRLSLNQKPHECPRCKREYPADKIVEYQRHVNRCFDSS